MTTGHAGREGEAPLSVSRASFTFLILCLHCRRSIPDPPRDRAAFAVPELEIGRGSRPVRRAKAVSAAREGGEGERSGPRGRFSSAQGDSLLEEAA